MRWKQIPGAAHDVGYGGKKVWVIGTNKEGGGYGIYRRDGSRWTKIGGSAVRIAVNGRGNAWVVNKYGNIYEYSGRRWYHRPGRAYDIGVYNNAVMVIGRNRERRMYRYNHQSKGWARTNSVRATSLALGPGGVAYVTSTSRNSIWQQSN